MWKELVRLALVHCFVLFIIMDANSQPIISVADAEAPEGTGVNDDRTLTFDVTLSEPALNDVFVDYRTVNGTSFEAVDFDRLSATNQLLVEAGETTAAITVQTSADDDVETDEFFYLELSNIENAITSDGRAHLRAVGTILEDDNPGDKLGLFVDEARILEGDAGSSSMVFTVRISRDPAASIDLDFATTDGAALAGEDYASTTGLLTFNPAGARVQQVPVTVTGDDDVEPTEFFSLSVTPTGAIANGVDGAVGLGVILDDDSDAALPVLSIGDARHQEGTGVNNDRILSFEVTLSKPALNDVFLDFRTISGTAFEDADFDRRSVTDQLVIPAGERSAIITVRTAADANLETDEFLWLELANVENAVLAGGRSTLRAIGTILDDDSALDFLGLFVNEARILEGNSGNGQAIFDVRLSRPSDAEIQLDFETSDGSALAGTDYQAADGTLTFAPGETRKAVFVTVTGDAEAEASEFFNLATTPPAAIANGVEGAVGQGIILDDDADAVLPVLSLSDARQIEGTGVNNDAFLSFGVSLSKPAASDVFLDYRTISGTAFERIDFDRLSVSDELIIPAGDTSALITVRTNADATIETDEFFELEIRNIRNAVAAGGQSTLRASGTILEDDTAGSRLGLRVDEIHLLEGGAADNREAVFNVRLSRPSDDELPLNWETADGSAVSGADYQDADGTVIFDPGEIKKAVRVPVLGDDESELSEFFNLVVTPPAEIANGVEGAVGQAVILDDDADAVLPVLSLSDARQIEGTGVNNDAFLSFEASLSKPAADDVFLDYRTISGTAFEGLDFDRLSETGALIIPAGETSALITARTNADSTIETDEFFELEIRNIQNAVAAGAQTTLRASGTILEDDTGGSRLGLLVGGVRLVEGDNGADREAVFNVRLSRPSDEALDLGFVTSDGTAIMNADYQETSGVLEFAPGEIEKAVRVAVLGDVKPEPIEFFNLILTTTAAIANGVEGAAAKCEILDDDTNSALPVLSLAGVRQSEGTGVNNDRFLSFEVYLSEPAVSDVVADYRATSGTAAVSEDFDPFSATGQVIIPAGNSSALLTVRTVADGTAEADEFFQLELSNIQNAAPAGGLSPLVAIGTILDDDTGGNRLALLTEKATARESRFALVPVNLSRPQQTALTLDYRFEGISATPGVDFDATPGSVTFQPGETKVKIPVFIFSDFLAEDEEQFLLVIEPTGEIASGSEGASGIVTIQDILNPATGVESWQLYK